MTLTQHLNQMKLSAFIAIAAVIGGSYLIPVPAVAADCSAMKIENQIEDQRSTNELLEFQAANRTASRQQRENAISSGMRPQLAATAQEVDDAFRAIAEQDLWTSQQKDKLKRDSEFKIQCM
jgi:hypothetical protein